MEAIKKLHEHNIFKKDSIVESVITKDWMGSPVEKKTHLIVRKVRENDCLCEEYGALCTDLVQKQQDSREERNNK